MLVRWARDGRCAGSDPPTTIALAKLLSLKTPEEIAEEKRLERNRKAREYYRKRKIERILRRELL